MSIFKKVALGLAAIATATMPLVASAAESVQIESFVRVGNVTTNADYAKSTNAKVDDVVKVEVTYHNKEEADSGKVANNLKVKINVPTTPGKTQTITSTVGGDNTNQVVDTATVNLTLDNAHLEYVPGSAKWRHNTGTNAAPVWTTQAIGDGVVTNGAGLVLENEQPCFNFAATVTILARVRANAVSITKQVRKVGEKTWVVSNSAAPGDTLEYLITFKNEGNTVLTNVAVGDNLPPHMTYVNGSTMLKNGANPNGIKINSDNITKGGIDVGNYTPGAVGYVWFQVKIDSNLAAGCTDFKNVGVVRPQGMNEFYNVAITKVCVATPQTPPTPVTPQTPTTPLPQTGAEAPIAGALGSGVLGYAVHSYRRSKRALVDALKR